MASGHWTPEQPNQQFAELHAGSAVGAVSASPGKRSPIFDDGVKSQVARELRGLNAILQIYGFGNEARYPMIDGPFEEPGTEAFKALVADAICCARGV